MDNGKNMPKFDEFMHAVRREIGEEREVIAQVVDNKTGEKQFEAGSFLLLSVKINSDGTIEGTSYAQLTEAEIVAVDRAYMTFIDEAMKSLCPNCMKKLTMARIERLKKSL
jgi:histidinol-phosphate/aromatic aminotransferase/cobyric acid decarboxylase-like protein